MPTTITKSPAQPSQPANPVQGIFFQSITSGSGLQSLCSSRYLTPPNTPASPDNAHNGQAVPT